MNFYQCFVIREHFQFQSTVAEFKVLLDCLRISRRAGVEMLLGTREANPSGEDSDKYWRGLIEYKTLDVNMFHQNDEVSGNTSYST